MLLPGSTRPQYRSQPPRATSPSRCGHATRAPSGVIPRVTQTPAIEVGSGQSVRRLCSGVDPDLGERLAYRGTPVCSATGGRPPSRVSNAAARWVSS